MALRGTLKDFGIADIFQLIGHQGKTGTLVVRERDREVHIVFSEGNVIRATSSSRKEREMLGSMLQRGEVITAAQLGEALDLQKRTGKRLGEILVDSGVVERATVQTFMRLQTHETLYQLFLWNNGTYEFTQSEVEVPPNTEPIRAESILMEGFRQVDEWPMIRKRITSYGITFQRLEDLDALSSAASASGGGGDDLDFDSAFGDLESGDAGRGDPRLKNIGQNERMVYQLVVPDRDVQKIIDLSRLGEFETCKALVTLVDASIIAIAAEAKTPSAPQATVGGITARAGGVGQLVLRVALAAALLGALYAGARYVGVQPRDWLRRGPPHGFTGQYVQSLITHAQLLRVEGALAVYRAEAGEYPAELEHLVDAGLLRPRDLRFPWKQPYYYLRKEGTYELLRPLY